MYTNDQNEVFYTVSEAAELLQVSVTWFYLLFKSGKLAKIKVSGKTFVKKMDLDNLFQPEGK